MAANPVTITCTADTWVLVADGVTTGSIYLLDRSPAKYLQTIRVDGDAAPTDLSDAAEVTGKSVAISSDDAIDVYIYAVGAAGKVRVDL